MGIISSLVGGSNRQKLQQTIQDMQQQTLDTGMNEYVLTSDAPDQFKGLALENLMSTAREHAPKEIQDRLPQIEQALTLQQKLVPLMRRRQQGALLALLAGQGQQQNQPSPAAPSDAGGPDMSTLANLPESRPPAPLPGLPPSVPSPMGPLTTFAGLVPPEAPLTRRQKIGNALMALGGGMTGQYNPLYLGQIQRRQQEQMMNDRLRQIQRGMQSGALTQEQGQEAIRFTLTGESLQQDPLVRLRAEQAFAQEERNRQRAVFERIKDQYSPEEQKEMLSRIELGFPMTPAKDEPVAGTVPGTDPKLITYFEREGRGQPNPNMRYHTRIDRVTKEYTFASEAGLGATARPQLLSPTDPEVVEFAAQTKFKLDPNATGYEATRGPQGNIIRLNLPGTRPLNQQESRDLRSYVFVARTQHPDWSREAINAEAGRMWMQEKGYRLAPVILRTYVDAALSGRDVPTDIFAPGAAIEPGAAQPTQPSVGAEPVGGQAPAGSTKATETMPGGQKRDVWFGPNGQKYLIGPPETETTVKPGAPGATVFRGPQLAPLSPQDTAVANQIAAQTPPTVPGPAAAQPQAPAAPAAPTPTTTPQRPGAQNQQTILNAYQATLSIAPGTGARGTQYERDAIRGGRLLVQKRLAQLGFSPANILQYETTYRGNLKALDFQVQSAAALDTLNQTIDQFGNRMIQNGRKLRDANSKFLNTPLRNLSIEFVTDPVLHQYLVDVNELKREYAQLTAGGAMSKAMIPVTINDEMEKIVNGNMALKDAIATVEEIRRSAGAAIVARRIAQNNLIRSNALSPLGRAMGETPPPPLPDDMTGAGVGGGMTSDELLRKSGMKKE